MDKVRRVTGKEALSLPLNFEITREMFEASIPQLMALLREDGFPEECLVSYAKGEKNGVEKNI